MRTRIDKRRSIILGRSIEPKEGPWPMPLRPDKVPGRLRGLDPLLASLEGLGLCRVAGFPIRCHPLPALLIGIGAA
jgi:hypothetical protein